MKEVKFKLFEKNKIDLGILNTETNQEMIDFQTPFKKNLLGNPARFGKSKQLVNIRKIKE